MRNPSESAGVRNRCGVVEHGDTIVASTEGNSLTFVEHCGADGAAHLPEAVGPADAVAGILASRYRIAPAAVGEGPAGTVTRNYLVGDRDGRRWFVKSYPPGTDLAAEREALALGEAARAGGVPVPAVRRCGGRWPVAGEVIASAGGAVSVRGGVPARRPGPPGRVDGLAGRPELGPYDRIFVSFAVPRIPSALVEQLAPGGRALMTLGTRSPSWPGLAVLARTAAARG
ncbi:phosphotransferase [Streptomyces sp. NPDC004126]|uniref:phosphotransferase n=1 Tax=Streptomyces sp. NPDC004126 TaxID=3390695 RepID=UPI003D078614